MPTADDYDLAAHAFESVRGRLPTLLTPASAHSSAIVGGALRRSLADLIAESTRRAQSCARELVDLVELCRFRAAHIRDLEQVQRIFDASQAVYLAEHERWLDASNRYLASPLEVAPPGPSPVPPTQPEPVPLWADLRP